MFFRKYLSSLLFCINLLFIGFLLLAYTAVYLSPELNAYLPFFGLAFPLVLLVNLCFVVFWLLLRNNYFLASVLVILLGMGHISTYFQISMPQPKQKGTTQELKVMSYNVRLFDLYNWSENRETRNEIFSLLREEDPDIICFQEFFYSRDTNYFPTRDTLLELLKAKYFHEEYTHEIEQTHLFGINTFSVHPIVNKGTIRFQNDENNICIFSDIVVNRDTLRIYNAHLASIRFKNEDYQFLKDVNGNALQENPFEGALKIGQRLKQAFVLRASQIEKIMDHINKSPYPVIFSGDFNDTPISYCYGQVTQELKDAFVSSGNGLGRSYAGSFPSYRIDYIFHSKSLFSADYQTLKKELSDHYPIQCRIRWKDDDH